MCVRRDNISKMESEVNIGSVHRFLRSQNKKPRTEPNKVGLDWFDPIEPDKVGYIFGLVRSRLSISSVLSEPLTPLLISI